MKLIDVCGREVRVEGRVLHIARPHGDRYRFVSDPATIIRGLRECGMRVDIFTFAQKLPNAERQFSYSSEPDNCAVLPVSTYDNWWTKQIRNKTRNEVRLSEKKGVTVREVPFDDALIAGIRNIYNECPIRQRRRFPHYGKDIATVRRENVTFVDSSIFIGAFFEGALIGFIKLVPDETCTQAGLMSILSMVKHRDKAPQNALIACAVRACASRGIGYLVYSKFDYGNRRDDGLRKFKEHNGFQRFETHRYYVPLTQLGSAAFRLGFHHSLGERLPEGFTDYLRELRGAWYGRRYRSVTEAT
jgi:hypothetical protein